MIVIHENHNLLLKASGQVLIIHTTQCYRTMPAETNYPASKLMYTLVRQASKPIATRVRNTAQRSNMFKKYVCLPPAWFYMWSERVVDRLARGGPPKEVPPYVEKKAVRLGANLIGEFIIFGTAATFISLEFLRQRRKRRLKQEEEMLGKQALRQQAREVQYNRDRRSAELDDLRRKMQNLKYRLLPPSLQGIASVTDGEPDAVSGIRIEDDYLAKGVAVRAKEGADDDLVERAAAEAARKVARVKGEDPKTVQREAAAAALQQSKKLKKEKAIREKEKDHDKDVIYSDAQSTTVNEAAAAPGVVVEAPKAKDEAKKQEREKIIAEAQASEILKDKKVAKKKSVSGVSKVEEMKDQEAEELETKDTEETVKVAIEKLAPGDVGKDSPKASDKVERQKDPPLKMLAPAGDSMRAYAEITSLDTANPLDAEKQGQQRNVPRRGSSLVPPGTGSLIRWKSGFAWTTLWYFCKDVFRLGHESSSDTSRRLDSNPVSLPASSPASDSVPVTPSHCSEQTPLLHAREVD